MALISEPDALQLVTQAMSGTGMSPDDAEVVADHLVDATLRGYPEFGVLRVLELADTVSRKSPGPITTVTETPTTAIIDGGGHIGYVVGRRAAELAIDKAEQSGIAAVGAHHTYFTGLLAYFCELAARHGMVSIATSSGEPLVAPHGAREARLGTNPIAIGFPGAVDPIVWDIGTSSIMRGDVWRRARDGRPLPPDHAVDEDGFPTTDAAAALRGAILPWGGHRGSGLSTMIQLFGALAGATFDPERDVGSSNGFFFIAVNPEALGGRARLLETTEGLAGFIRSAASVDEQVVRLPFERSIRAREAARRTGIHIDDNELTELRALAARLMPPR